MERPYILILFYWFNVLIFAHVFSTLSFMQIVLYLHFYKSLESPNWPLHLRHSNGIQNPGIESIYYLWTWYVLSELWSFSVDPKMLNPSLSLWHLFGSVSDNEQKPLPKASVDLWYWPKCNQGPVKRKCYFFL